MKTWLLSLGCLSLLLFAACNNATAPTSTASPSASPASGSPTTEKVSFSVANQIIQQRCSMCHSAAGGQSPRAGVAMDTPEQIKARTERIRARAVSTQSMPQGNATQMTEAERKTLGDWIAQGASLE
ncbi:hypothetical protein COW36_13325 [bacterium (Candidatus Blackallbacteria) CG17_big_fil_post_rev_8_21_14_2_50_48_46]|uniref:Cytochrome c domain-containing protein n=1 Tax=bacterium (Candidatus Blackallbacteria) CG17_big_fil_post_rev_8_21_14_2_50_48_46 TaxID=2014261 RepID=A0A2M7G3K7_9BACT|nr:MAG: hypothetical protein COW64_21940 [bacterium (Candidatus Blackallbacteria) CG18_big_fil_WC_8_21_14_2_50_49_26]PIW16311.1 MAG: hypothetical protein COW36_13325 [bacterium (Candidatus Blackallbacteria) CG17_big_fil_post_rev_8_21_14_2_50_48_46]PIW45325.1 MAG: hypothetical protein COW20_20560 [bacterium (Candidatus Blackallbacteria) CG13_big_fil_rev_8_21_14_2_50_49_14]